MKELDPVWGARAGDAPPLDPPMISVHHQFEFFVLLSLIGRGLQTKNWQLDHTIQKLRILHVGPFTVPT